MNLEQPLITAQLMRQAFSDARKIGPAMGDEGASVTAEIEETVAAAVLIPVVEREGHLSLLLTRRTDHLHHHPGQISFPGGRTETSDASPAATALRETWEEIGLPAERIELLGEISNYITITGFRIHPLVGLVHPPFELAPDTFEVAEIFEVPLAFMLNPANWQRQGLQYQGRMRHYYAIAWQGYHIWGATAGMLVILSHFLHESGNIKR